MDANSTTEDSDVIQVTVKHGFGQIEALFSEEEFARAWPVLDQLLREKIALGEVTTSAGTIYLKADRIDSIAVQRLSKLKANTEEFVRRLAAVKSFEDKVKKGVDQSTSATGPRLGFK